jgi:hypothetical protein
MDTTIYVKRTLTGYVFVSLEEININLANEIKSNQKRIYMLQNPMPDFTGYDFATGDNYGVIKLYKVYPYYFSATRPIPPEAIIPYELSNRTCNPKEAEEFYLLNRQADQSENRLLYALSNIAALIPFEKQKPQERISKLVISDAIVKGDTCPISLTPLTQESAVCVAPCYHVFEKGAIMEWLKTKSICPSCRVNCSL